MTVPVPVGWVTTSLGDVCEEKVAQGPPTDEPVPYIDISAIDRTTKRVSQTTLVRGKDAPTRARQWVRTGDVLVSMTRPNLNAVASVTPDLDGAVASTGFDVLRSRGVVPEWIYYRVRSNEFVADVCEGLQGVVYPAIRPHDVRRHQLPLAPLLEQQRIVEALESYFTRLDDAVATLERVLRNLKRYRASVLKAAVEGRLVPTEAELARSEGRSYEPASVLLARILTERRRRWEEAELAKMTAKGKAPKDDKWKAKYVEPVAPDTSGLPELPEGWCWASIDQIAHLVRNGYSKKPASDGAVRILRISAVRAMNVDFTDVRWLPGSPEDYSEDLVAQGDLLFTRYNGSPALVGVAGLVRSLDRPTVHPDKLIKVRLLAAELDLAYLELASNTGASRLFIERRTRTTAGQAGISGGDIKQMPIPLPPRAEQSRISGEADRSLTLADAARATLVASTPRAARLRQSILKWAFEGWLVDQDPTDEPASVLLERIRAEREAADGDLPSRGHAANSRRRGRSAAKPGPSEDRH